jgi:uncharacterized membrane protein YeaQ/YmgE (transglycosylase-associated protein family)
MAWKMYVYGGIIYVVLAIVLGMIGGIVPGLNLAPYAILIAALIAGIYVGRKAGTPTRGAIDGIIAGIIGGIIAGIIAPFFALSGSTGFPLLDSIATMIGSTITSYVTVLAGFGFFIGAGIILGAIGGYLGKKILKK